MHLALRSWPMGFLTTFELWTIGGVITRCMIRYLPMDVNGYYKRQISVRSYEDKFHLVQEIAAWLSNVFRVERNAWSFWDMKAWKATAHTYYLCTTSSIHHAYMFSITIACYNVFIFDIHLTDRAGKILTYSNPNSSSAIHPPVVVVAWSYKSFETPQGPCHNPQRPSMDSWEKL